MNRFRHRLSAGQSPLSACGATRCWGHGARTHREWAGTNRRRRHAGRDSCLGTTISNAIAAVMNQSRYAEYTQWGIYAADRETGEAVYDLDSVQRYVPGSTTKLFPAAAALTSLWTGLPFPDTGLSPG